MKYKWKKLIALSLIVCMSGMLTVGCSSGTAAGDEVNSPTKLDAPEPITDEADETETDDDADLSTQPDDAETGDNDVTSNDTENSGTDPSDDAGTNTENASESSGKWHVYDADLAAAVDADFEGSVYVINADSFSILPNESELMEDGSLLKAEIAPGVEISEEDLVKITFDDNTVFTLRDIYDGGARYEDSNVSFEDVQKGISVSLKGEFENDIFHASAVRIIKVH